MQQIEHVYPKQSFVARSAKSSLRGQVLRWKHGLGMWRTTKEAVWRTEDQRKGYLWGAALNSSA
jgi:hypothetical protein